MSKKKSPQAQLSSYRYISPFADFLNVLLEREKGEIIQAATGLSKQEIQNLQKK